MSYEKRVRKAEITSGAIDVVSGLLGRYLERARGIMTTEEYEAFIDWLESDTPIDNEMPALVERGMSKVVNDGVSIVLEEKIRSGLRYEGVLE